LENRWCLAGIEAVNDGTYMSIVMFE